MSGSRTFIRSVGTVGFMTGLSRLLGLVRDVLMAASFGTSMVMSSFVVAFTIPNLFRRLFGEGALSAAFVPVFVDMRKRDGAEAAWLLAGRVALLLTVTLLILMLAGWGLLLGLGAILDGSMEQLTVDLLGIMLPYMLFICLAALCMSLLNACGHFAMPAFAPCLLNGVWIATIIFGFRTLGSGSGDEMRIRMLAWAIVAAGILQCIVQFPVLYQKGFRFRFSWAPSSPGVQRVLCLMGPGVLGMAVTQLNVMIDRLLAAGIGSHAPAALFFSERLIYFPLGLFATAMGTVLLPTLSNLSVQRRLEMVNQSVRLLCFMMVPAAAGLFVLAGPIIRMLLEWGSFQGDSVFYTTTALMFYAPGLVVFSLVKVLVPVFYSDQDTWTPVRIGLGAVFLNLALNLLFFFTWPQPIRHAGLALATVLSGGVQAALLGILVHRRYGSPGWRQMARALIRFGLLTLLSAATAWLLEGFVYEGMVSGGAEGKMARIVSVCSAMVAAAALYMGMAAIFRWPEFIRCLDAVYRRNRPAT